MRQQLQTPARPRGQWRAALSQPPVRFGLRALGAYILAFLLACVSAGSRTLPFGSCVCAVLSGLPALLATVGAVLGYFTMFPFLEALEPAAAAVMLFCLSTILRQSELRQGARTLPFLAFCSTCSVGLIYALGQSPVALVWLLLRCGLAVGTVIVLRWGREQLRMRPEQTPAERTDRTAQMLLYVERLLRSGSTGEQGAELASLYDQVSDCVCLRCPGYHGCWELEAAETYRSLRAAAANFLPRGVAQAADFPQSFFARCRNLDGFVSAVNRELDNRLSRLQASNRLAEYRQVLCGQYRILANLLSDRLPQRAKSRPRFQPELGVRALGRRGSRISGDRGACFTENGLLYLLLCDGMGTGADAAQEAGRAISLLTGLLRAGAEPEEALQLLDGVYILRGDGCFSTVDLLILDLSTASGTLYKWGAAPSYLLRSGHVKKIGTAAPPPGIGTQDAYRPERLRLSLSRGETLVLVSDGAAGTRTEACLAALTSEDPQKIASEVIAQHREDGEDDMSAVVLRLHPDEAG